MACIGRQNMNSSQFPDVLSPSFTRARRPALIPPNCSLSPAEAEELIRTRTYQLLFPPPDPNLLRDARPTSPARSDSTHPELSNSATDSEQRRYQHSQFDNSASTAAIPPSIARDPRRRAHWIKARAQYARDWSRRGVEFSQEKRLPSGTDVVPPKRSARDFGPKRKHSAFIIDEELKCRLEDRVGTPHLSELLPGDDISGQLNVEELRMGGEAAALEEEFNTIPSDTIEASHGKIRPS
ncbi:uncharacterized protein BDR25DRAFT_308458 [Lindgomyces ingoldianus]|uniref:Uncharacterized protein n=1 Tax=Lindgomyces ingoldianus TaxID=673940 RepID=A0ACB6REI5_9PLEO|nr:uncharacterized protein BDR25DRAFT_308458 [Lindgomyces ingoldianus]KAF2477551.1 hypothetical protein BDR25DRAFT_308458 [Lindgomyces ingoldianus]